MQNDIHFSKYRWNCTMSELSAIRRAIEMGVAYLESAQLPSGEIPIEVSPTPEMSGACVREPVVFPAALAGASVVDHTIRRTASDGTHSISSSAKWSPMVCGVIR